MNIVVLFYGNSVDYIILKYSLFNLVILSSFKIHDFKLLTFMSTFQYLT